jgi:hypothetical protein
LSDGAEFYWSSLDLEDGGSSPPPDMLYKRFVPEAEPSVFRTAGSLAVERQFSNRLVWIDRMPPPMWPSWKCFLRDYAHACRSRDELDRSIFVVCLAGELALDPPDQDVCLTRHIYRGFVRRIDMMFYADSCFQDWPSTGLDRELAVQIATHLAIWDPMLAQKLASADRRTLFNPWTFLQELAQDRQRQSEHQEMQSPAWHAGAVDQVDGREVAHTLAVVLGGQRHEIDRRLWSAEVGVLFPFVEERRREILEALKSLIRVPHQTASGVTITDLRDLEIGHIHHQLLNNGCAVDGRTRRLVHALRDLRNALSHLEPVDPDLLLSSELREFEEILQTVR